MKIHRQIWIDANGYIPTDAFGRTYEIHHIDGNNKNNAIENLKCVSIQEHYNIHYEQGDYEACLRIARRMKMSPEEIHALAVMGGKMKKGMPKTKVVCPKCGKVGNKDAMTRWHFDNCGIFQPAKPATKMTCTKCGKVGSARVMRRWHFDNCGKEYKLTDTQREAYKKPKKRVYCEVCNKDVGSSGYYRHLQACINKIKTLNV